MLAEAPLSSLSLALRGADAPKLVVKSANALVRASRISRRVAFAVTNAKTSARIEGMNGNVSVAPASVTKAITALYAFAIFSDDKKYVRGFQRRILKHLRGLKPTTPALKSYSRN